MMDWIMIYILLNGTAIQSPTTPLECAEYAIKLTEGRHPSDDDGTPIVYSWCGQRRLLDAAMTLKQKQLSASQ